MKTAPVAWSPESQSPFGAPGVPEVLLCIGGPPYPSSELQVHCTVSPGWIVTDAGEKQKQPLPTVTVTVVAFPAVG